MRGPAISVIVPLYNGVATIERALDSVMSQDHRDLEILVVDDCSSDAGPDLVDRRYSASGVVRLVRCERNGGPAVARNRGMAEASGEWLALLDADDVWMPGRIDHMMPHFADADVVADGIVGFDVAADCFTGPILDIVHPGRLGLADIATKTWEGRAFDSGFLKPFFRRAFVERHQLTYDPRLRQGEDWLLYLECAAVGADIRLVDALGYGYSTWVGEVSRVRSASSHTRPDGEALADAISGLIARREDLLAPTDMALLTQTAAAIRHDSGAWDFHYAVLQRDPVGIAAALLRHPSARRAAMLKVKDRLLGKARAA